MSSDENDFNKIYEYSEWVRNTERAEVAGIEKIILLPSFDALRPLLVPIEVMAREIEQNNNTADYNVKHDKSDKPMTARKPLRQRYFYLLKAFYYNHLFSERYVYSPHVSAVCEACCALGLHPLAFEFREPGTYDPACSKTDGEVFDEVVVKTAEILASPAFKERLRLRVRNANHNEEKGLLIEQKVFENNSKLLVLMLHFGYLAQHRAKISIEENQKHRKKFFNNCRSNSLLRGIVDYIWTLEEGDEAGVHLHMLIFYTADSCCNEYIAKQIGEYWERVAEGKGQYWNSNANEAFHAKYGHGIATGEINWNDEAKRHALRENICYMTKADQFLKLKYSKQCHLFGTSMVAKKKKLGPPTS